MLTMKWSYVSIIYEESNYGIKVSTHAGSILELTSIEQEDTCLIRRLKASLDTFPRIFKRHAPKGQLFYKAPRNLYSRQKVNKRGAKDSR